MVEFTRRDAVKAAAASGIVLAGAGLVHADDEQKQQRGGDQRKYKSAEERWAGHKTADAKSLEKMTKPIPVSIGVDPPGESAPKVNEQFQKELEAAYAPMGIEPVAEYWGRPRPDLNGLRVKLPNRREIYLIDRGYRRWVPNPATYNNLFRDWDGVVIDIDIDEIPVSHSLTSGAHLARAFGTAPIYLIDRGMKRWVASPAIMDQYYFAWKRVYVLPPATIDAIPTGTTIDS